MTGRAADRDASAVSPRARRALRRFLTNPLALVGTVVLGVVTCCALAPDVVAPHDPEWVAYVGTGDGRLTLAQSRSLPHPPAFGDPFFAPLGTTASGHGVFTELVYGARTALLVGLAAALLSSLVGVPLGLCSGYYGGWVDEAIQRVVDVLYGVPFLPFVIVLVAIRGASTTTVVLAIAATSWLNNCVVVRGTTLSLVRRTYVDAARAAGLPAHRIVARHVLPDVLPVAAVLLVQDAATAILAHATLAYLGLADVTTASWGVLLQQVQATGHVFDAPWWLLPPGLAIASLVAAFYYVGHAVEDVTGAD
ncbi:ABC transporter permease [Halarchaeum nitratireducens]|uniref:Peptide ABC transporter permease n=1 Tax=Halarchaeum nitratireducens TaxID=489913 RepID=A0A830GCA5_9EURY|nr:ABC transporter permease [Halarchaeum nitratireducens]GGN17996.1 peptide ABC transporter permease [Halarchaeum nitratireducens]